MLVCVAPAVFHPLVFCLTGVEKRNSDQISLYERLTPPLSCVELVNDGKTWSVVDPGVLPFVCKHNRTGISYVSATLTETF